MVAAVERALPGLTRREWGAIAVAAAARAGLEEPDLASLRVHLRDQFAVDRAAEPPMPFRPGDIVVMRSGGPDMTVLSYNDRYVPVEVEVRCDGARQTMPADLVELKHRAP